jgi:hypothetical protein
MTPSPPDSHAHRYNSSPASRHARRIGSQPVHAPGRPPTQPSEAAAGRRRSTLSSAIKAPAGRGAAVPCISLTAVIGTGCGSALRQQAVPERGHRCARESTHTDTDTLTVDHGGGINAGNAGVRRPAQTGRATAAISSKGTPPTGSRHRPGTVTGEPATAATPPRLPPVAICGAFGHIRHNRLTPCRGERVRPDRCA